MLGGFAMNESLKAKCLQADLNILLSYGMTEAAAALAVSRLSEEPGYRLLSHINATIDSNSEEQSGVVIIESAALADCYLDGQRIKPEFKSSDVGKIAKGRLQILGRMDRVINSGGVKIHPEEIEILVSQISGVIATAVIPIKDLKWGERPLLFLESEIDLDSNSIFDFLRKNLSDYKVPERIVKCKIPRLANGKINYSELSKNSAELLDTLS